MPLSAAIVHSLKTLLMTSCTNRGIADYDPGPTCRDSCLLLAAIRGRSHHPPDLRILDREIHASERRAFGRPWAPRPRGQDDTVAALLKHTSGIAVRVVSVRIAVACRCHNQV